MSNPRSGDLEEQLMRITEVFRKMSAPPLALRADDVLEVQRLSASGGGWTPLDPVLLDSVRSGAQVGTPLPAQRRLFLGLENDLGVAIVGTGADRCVAVFFTHEAFPDRRFGHRFEPLYEHDWVDFMEAIETGEIQRMMRQPPLPDEDGITWTTWGWNRPD